MSSKKAVKRPTPVKKPLKFLSAIHRVNTLLGQEGITLLSKDKLSKKDRERLVKIIEDLDQPREACRNCHGDKVCDTCTGTGECPDCHGSGDCSYCDGSGMESL